jgi:hypothetical protein
VSYLFGLGLLAVGVWTVALARDLPRRASIGVAALGAVPLTIGLLLAELFSSQAGASLGFIYAVMLGSFILVTRGHVIRSVDADRLPFEVPADIRARYMQAVSRHQVAGLAVGLVVLGAVIVATR